MGTFDRRRVDATFRTKAGDGNLGDRNLEGLDQRVKIHATEHLNVDTKNVVIMMPVIVEGNKVSDGETGITSKTGNLRKEGNVGIVGTTVPDI